MNKLKIIERIGAGIALLGSAVWFLWPGEGWSPDPEPLVAIVVTAFAWIALEISAEPSGKQTSNGEGKLSTDQTAQGFAIVVGSHHQDGQNLWEASGLIGTGDAIAAGRIFGYVQELGAKNCEIVSAHNYPGTKLNKNLILVGGPDANEVTRRLMEKLSTRLRFGDPSQHVISIVDAKTGDIFNPGISSEGQITSDHGLVIKSENPYNPKAVVLVLAGGFGQGSLAAALFASNEDLLSLSTFGSFENYEALVQSDVIDQWPQSPRLLQVHKLAL